MLQLHRISGKAKHLLPIIRGATVRQTNSKQQVKIAGTFVDVISKNGNFVLNLGPKADGTFCEEEMQILEKLSDWTAKTRSNMGKLNRIRFSEKEKNTVTAHLTKSIITLVRITALHTKRIAFTYLY